MSGAEDTALALTERLLQEGAAIAAAVTVARQAQNDVRGAADLDEAMRAAVGWVLACEALAKVGKAAEEAARAALRDAMAETGCPEVVTMSKRAILAEPTPSATITDEALLQDEWWSPRKPDRTQIAKALRAGKAVPGATLNNGGPQILSIRSRT